jgi:hypothetical protein
MENEGINRLARVMDGRTKYHNARPPLLDFGEIQKDMSLLTNKFPLPIPQTDYVVCRSVQWGAIDDIYYQTQHPDAVEEITEHRRGEHYHGKNGKHDHPDGSHIHPADDKEMQHVHDMLIGPKFRWLMPGDRVLVAWVGDDACVVDIIYPATRIGRDANSYAE